MAGRCRAPVGRVWDRWRPGLQAMRRLCRAVPATAAVNPIGGYVILIIAATGVWAVHGPMCAPASQHTWLSVL